MKKTILICKGISKYNIIEMYLDEFARGFCELGYDVIMWDMSLDSRDLWGTIRKILRQQEIYALVDVNGGVTGAGGMIPDDADLLCLSYFCDHPLHHAGRLQNMRDDTVITVLDRAHLRYLHTYYPKFAHSGFVPLGGMCREERQKVPYRERKMDVIFTGSYWKPQPLPEFLPDDFAGQLWNRVWEALLSQTDLTLEDAFTKVLEEYRIAVSNEEFTGLLEELGDIDHRVRTYFRDKILRILLRAGIEVYVVGEGWEALECEGQEHLHVLTGDAETALRLLGEAKIAFNVMPWFKEGFQERIANGMLSGAVAVTDTSRYIEEAFEDGRDLVLYDLGRLDELPDKIRKLLADDERAEKIAERGRKKAEEGHLWRHRVCRMAELLEQARGGRIPGGTGSIRRAEEILFRE